jgi:hypothetical protein
MGGGFSGPETTITQVDLCTEPLPIRSVALLIKLKTAPALYIGRIQGETARGLNHQSSEHRFAADLRTGILEA